MFSLLFNVFISKHTYFQLIGYLFFITVTMHYLKIEKILLIEKFKHKNWHQQAFNEEAVTSL